MATYEYLYRVFYWKIPEIYSRVLFHLNSRGLMKTQSSKLFEILIFFLNSFNLQYSFYANALPSSCPHRGEWGISSLDLWLGDNN